MNNFMSVHRLRPHDDDDAAGNSDDLVADEPVELSHDNLADALSTRVGGPRGEGSSRGWAT